MMLLSAIMAMGNLGENFELLAMKSAGLSLPRIMSPLIAVGGLIITALAGPVIRLVKHIK